MTLRPYFERDGVMLYHASCMDLMATMAPRSVGCTITDPPYTDGTHKGMRSNKRGEVDYRTGGRRIDFPPVASDVLAEMFAEVARVTRRWTVATVAYQHAAKLEESPPPMSNFVRCGVWAKIAPTPQMSGDRPGQGWESVAILHADDLRTRWNGGGRSAVWHCRPEMEGDYPTQKPEPLIDAFIRDFCDPGESIFDPFAGGGTTLVCAWKAGHPVIGCDIREEACEVAARRLERVMAQGRLDLPARVKAVQTGLF